MHRDHEALCEATYAARDAAWATAGRIDPYALSPLINPAFSGGPTWPNLRQAYKVVHTPMGTLIASDGLADPFDDSWRDPPQQNGFGLEVYAIGGDTQDESAQQRWLLPLVAGFAQVVADHGHVHTLLAELGTITTELWDIPIPDDHRATFVNEHGRVGVVVGMEADGVPSWFDGPVSRVRLANLKLLTVRELDEVLAGGDAGRHDIVARLLATDQPLVSSLLRPSV